jgi:allophanate hydrolase
MAVLKIDHAGPLVTIQDQGRPNYMRYGVTPGGPMDRRAFALGHYALGQEPRASIEISMGGLNLTCVTGGVTACVTGGGFTVILEGKTLPPWSAFELTEGAKLQIRAGEWGSWCYLAFAGDIDAPTWLNSASTHLASDQCGVPLQMDDKIAIDNTRTNATSGGELLDAATLKPSKQIRVIMGPQDRYFSDETIAEFECNDFTLTPEYNRQGVRLSGPTLNINQPLDMPSEPIARGSLQVPGHGDPIALMADHQTTGGYPKIATIISTDQDQVAQMRAGDTLRFLSVDIQTATAAARDANAKIATLRQQIDDKRMSLEQKLWNNNLVSGAIDTTSQ